MMGILAKGQLPRCKNATTSTCARVTCYSQPPTSPQVSLSFTTPTMILLPIILLTLFDAKDTDDFLMTLYDTFASRFPIFYAC